MNETPDCPYCHDDLKVSVTVANVITKCKYHRRIGQEYKHDEIAPKGLCRTMFYRAYPTALAILYHGKPKKFWFRGFGKDTAVVSCPAENGVKVKITSREKLPAPIRLLKELAEEVLKLVLRGYDAPFREVALEVVEAGSSCPKGYSVGQKYYFNTDDTKELCPAAFSTTYPYMNYLAKTKRATGKPCSMKVHCPDFVGVTFDVKVE
ncbi:MAG: TIGR04076 family protein [Pseudomonadota bacterium]|nr:TIGR04076 family protein [Pseudomonadota bacterium]